MRTLRVVSSFLVVVMITVTLLPLAKAQSTNEVRVFLDGVPVIFPDQKPVIISGRTFVPVRFVSEALGAGVEWSDTNQSVIIIQGGKVVVLAIGGTSAIVDDEIVLLDVPARIISGRTMVPLRFISEVLGAAVEWSEITYAVYIVSENRGSSVEDGTDVADNTIETEIDIQLQETIRVLEEKVIFENDISIFALFAFMNFTGYDDENNPQGFHSVRKAVRHDLLEMNLTLRDNRYYINKKAPCHYYVHVLRLMDGSSNFRIGQNLPDYLSNHGLSDLEVHLKEFYEKANIEELFAKYNPHYLQEMELYSEPIHPILAKTNEFLRVNINDIPEFYFQVNLLDAYWRGSGLGGTFKHKGKGILITGPSVEPNLKNVVHEYLHGIITPLNNQLRVEIEGLAHLAAKVPQNTQASSQTYPSWFAVFDESLVRALDGKFLDGQDNLIQNSMDQGFILTEYFYREFEKFGAFDGTLKEFLKILIADIKASELYSFSLKTPLT